MYRIIGYILILSMTCLMLAGCQRAEETENYDVVKYETKTYQGMSDKDVELKYHMEKNKGSLELRFSKKAIPFEIQLNTEAPTYEGGLNISGYLDKGKVKIVVLSSTRYILWEEVFSSGKLQAKPRFEMYSGEYILRLEFFEAKDGNIKIKFLTAQS